MNGPAKVAVVIATFTLLSLVTAFAVREGRGRARASAHEDVPAVTHEVRISAMRFEPALLDARPGDTVVWINDDFLPHTATSTSKTWDSGEIAPGASWRLVVGADGAGDYLCTFHPMMTGRVGGDGADE